VKPRVKHEWRPVHGVEERARLGHYPLASVRLCATCGASQHRESTYNGAYGRDGPKVTGHVWRPLVPRCRVALGLRP
jgi:hypothetical protein